MMWSNDVQHVFAALAKANAALKSITKDRTNPHFRNRYATLDAIMDAVRPVLAANGLSIVQGAKETTEGFNVVTMLCHVSGQFISNVVPVPISKQDAQGVGSALTYGRRYGVSALLALATDDDDDGNAASKPPAKPPARPAAKPEQPKADVTLEAAMTFAYPGKGDHHGKPRGEVPVDALASALDIAVKANDSRFAAFIAHAERVLAFHRTPETTTNA